MYREEQIAFLKTLDVHSLPDFALKVMDEEEASDEELAKCEAFCVKVSAALNQTQNQTQPPAPMNSEEAEVELLSKFEEASFPEYALKRLYGQPMTDEEVKQCAGFCEGLKGVEPPARPEV